MGSSCEARLIHAPGGGSGSQAMLQTLADVFGVNVVRQRNGAAAVLGAAMHALHQYSTIFLHMHNPPTNTTPRNSAAAPTVTQQTAML